MSTEDFERRKEELFKKLKSAERMNENLEKEIIEVYGSRGKRAIEVIKNDGIRKESGRWFVQGSEEEYEIVQSHCSCYDYVLNIATEKAEVDMCYHALAKKIKELLNTEKAN